MTQDGGGISDEGCSGGKQRSRHSEQDPAAPDIRPTEPVSLQRSGGWGQRDSVHSLSAVGELERRVGEADEAKMAAKLQLKQVMEGQSILSHLISSFLGVSVGGANLPLNSESVQHVARYSGTLSLSLSPLSLSLSLSLSLQFTGEI